MVASLMGQGGCMRMLMPNYLPYRRLAQVIFAVVVMLVIEACRNSADALNTRGQGVDKATVQDFVKELSPEVDQEGNVLTLPGFKFKLANNAESNGVISMTI